MSVQQALSAAEPIAPVVAMSPRARHRVAKLVSGWPRRVGARYREAPAGSLTPHASRHAACVESTSAVHSPPPAWSHAT